MAQQTSALWKTLWRTPGTTREYGFDIAGKWYGPEQEIDHSVDGGLYEQFGTGNAVVSKLTISLFAEDIPRAARIKRFIRLRNGDQTSEWLPKGVFYSNRRSSEDGNWTVEALDSMYKADREWEPDQSLNFPLSMPDAAAEFARLMGVELDPRTKLNAAYTIDYPASDPDSETGGYYSIRQELQWIAAAHLGNWIMTGEDRLLLVPLLSIPPETNYLVTEYGGAIKIGGVKLLV